jgi:ParB family chromosome partitioning protein
MVQQGDISQGHARALLPLGDEQEQVEFAKKIKQNGLSVRATESGVTDRIQALDGGELRIVDAEGNSHAVPRPRNEQLESLQQELRTSLGTKVDLSQSAKGKGKLTIHFTSHEEFERIRQLLTATQQAATTAPPQQYIA